jgi:bile acid-coenzyme A ligase
MSEIAPAHPRQMSMGMALSWQAERDPEAPALTMGEQHYSRVDLDRAANRLARALAERGVGQDDKVVVLLPTEPKHQITCFAIWKLGATAIPLPPRLVNRELLHLVDQANPKLVIGVDPSRLPDRQVLPADFLPDTTLSDEPLTERVSTMWKASASGGSTGMPKLIWEHRSSLIDPETPIPILRLAPGEVMLHPAGAYHNAAFSQTNWALCWGCHIILMQRFDALEWLRTVEHYRVNWAYMVPTMMSRVLALPSDVRDGFDVSSLRMVMHMAAPCPAWVKQAWIDWVGADAVWEIYGGTEGYGATMIGGNEWLANRGSVGMAPPGTSVRSDDGFELPRGEVGTIYFTPAPGNPMGHSEEPRTFGDAGYISENGYLYLADRRTDMVLSGGVNLYPAEIEGVIEQFPGVVVCAVVGLPDADLGARAHAIIELEPDAPQPDADALRTFLADNLSATKIPYTCEFTCAALRDEAGKLRRVRLREERLESGNSGYLPLRGQHR